MCYVASSNMHQYCMSCTPLYKLIRSILCSCLCLMLLCLMCCCKVSVNALALAYLWTKVVTKIERHCTFIVLFQVNKIYCTCDPGVFILYFKYILHLCPGYVDTFLEQNFRQITPWRDEKNNQTLEQSTSIQYQNHRALTLWRRHFELQQQHQH